MAHFLTAAFHGHDPATRIALQEVAEHAAAKGRAAVTLARLDQESAARAYLEAAIAHDGLPEVASPAMDGTPCEWRAIGSQTVSFTGTFLVRFRQHYDRIPVYGSLATVELGRRNALMALNVRVAMPTLRSTVARIAPHAALTAAAKAAGWGARLPSALVRPFVYVDRKERWRLVWIVNDVPVRRRAAMPRQGRSSEPERFDDVPLAMMDYIVDAMTGRFVDALPRHSTLSEETTATDSLGVSRKFRVETASGGRRLMLDTTLNVATHDLQWLDPSDAAGNRPGPMVARPPAFSPAAVSAHFNASQFSRFLRNDLGRLNWDGRGGRILSSINSVRNGDGTPKSSRGASWTDDQVVFGQVRLADGTLRSYAAGTEVVGHEMFHGVIDATARIETINEPGALNESLADIIGTIFRNRSRTDIAAWDWVIGNGVAGRSTALRSLRRPADFGHPSHMRDYRAAAGVHANAGIHNHAGYRLITAQSGGAFLFTAQQAARIYYHALLQLTATSRFADCRRAVIAAIRTIFAGSTQAEIDERVGAAEAAYAAVGIV